MSARDESAELAAAVAREGALPWPVAPEPSELERLRLRVDEVERAYTFDTAELKRRVGEAVATVARQAQKITELERIANAERARVAELEAQREALAERLRTGQQWRQGRNPELVSENFVSQSELRSIFGIPLVAPWADALTKAFVPVASLREPEGEFYPAVHHSYRVSHDLPELGGTQ